MLMQMPGPRNIVIYWPGPWAFSVVQKPWGWAHILVQKPQGARGVVTVQIDTCITASFLRHGANTLNALNTFITILKKWENF